LLFAHSIVQTVSSVYLVLLLLYILFMHYPSQVILLSC
jgi:hypothetical protein